MQQVVDGLLRDLVVDDDAGTVEAERGRERARAGDERRERDADRARVNEDLVRGAGARMRQLACRPQREA